MPVLTVAVLPSAKPAYAMASLGVPLGVPGSQYFGTLSKCDGAIIEARTATDDSAAQTQRPPSRCCTCYHSLE